jgi:hypothetical protein
MSIISELTKALPTLGAPRYVVALAEETADHQRAIADMAAILELPVAIIQERFNHYVAEQAHPWRSCFAWFKAGDREVWEALRNG